MRSLAGNDPVRSEFFLEEAELSNSVTADPDDTGDPNSLPPLTRNGYQRFETTEADILALLPAAPPDLVRAFQIDEDEPGYRVTEALIFFIRRAWREGDRSLMKQLADVLIHRCTAYFAGAIRGLDSEARMDAQQDVFADLFRLVLAADDRGDFLESRFFTYLKRKTATAKGKIRRNFYRAPLIADFVGDADQEDKFVAEHREELELANAEHALIASAVGKLPDPLRELVVLRYFKEWQIGDERNKIKDDQRETLAKKFGVTPRTIHNWLKEAYKLMEKIWKDDQ